MKKILGITTALVLAYSLQSSTVVSNKIAFTYQGQPIPGNQLDSYMAIVVTGAVANASQEITLERSTNLLSWSSLATNKLVEAHGKFWLNTDVDMAWTIFYDYGWTTNPHAFYRIKE